MLAHDRVHRRQAQTAGSEDHRLVALVAVQLAGLTQRAGDPGEQLAHGHGVHGQRAGAHALDDQGDGAGLGVPIGQGERNQFALLVGQHAHELSGLRSLGDHGCADHELFNAVGQMDLFQDHGCLGGGIGVGQRLVDPGPDLRCGHVADRRHDLLGRRLAVTGRPDRGRAAASGIAAGVDTGQRGLLRCGADLIDGAPFAGLQARLGILDDRVGVITQRHDHQVGVDVLGFAGGHRTAASRIVGLTQCHLFHHRGGDEVGAVLVEELHRRAQLGDHDALFQGVFEFFFTGRHLGLGATVDDRYLAAQALGGTCGVHGGVAAADDEDFLAGDFR